MSSDLKDARWQLAMEIAYDDGKDFYEMGYPLKSAYLAVAQNRLNSAWGQEQIPALAQRFRDNG